MFGSFFEKIKPHKRLTMPATLIGIVAFLSSCNKGIDRETLNNFAEKEGIAKVSVDKIHTVDSLLHDAAFLKHVHNSEGYLVETSEGKIVISKDIGSPDDGLISWLSVEDVKGDPEKMQILSDAASGVGSTVDKKTGIVVAATRQHVLDEGYILGIDGPKGNADEAVSNSEQVLDEVITLSQKAIQ